MTARGRAGFSIIEVVISLVIILLLITVTISWFRQPAADAAIALTRVELEKIATMIETVQLERRAAYRSASLPPNYRGSGEDSWNMAFQIDPETRSVRSAGPDRHLDLSGHSDDISVQWEEWKETFRPVQLPPPRPELSGSGTVLIRWDPVEDMKNLELHIASEGSSRSLSLPPDQTSWELALPPRLTHTFRLETIDGQGLRRSSSGVPFFLPAASPPTLSVAIDRPRAPLGSRVRISIRALSHGSELAQLTVGEKQFALKGASRTIAVEEVLQTRGTRTIPITLTDVSGQVVTRDVTVVVE